MQQSTPPIVSIKWLKEKLNQPNIVVLDASQYPEQNDTFIKEQKGIPGARFFDLKNKFAETDTQFPNTIPSPEKFEKNVQKLGISNEDTIIVYDNKGIYSSPRAWWLFRIMGHKKVFVLDGGLPAWIDSDYPIENIGLNVKNEGNFKAKYQSSLFKSYIDILKNIENHDSSLIDARSSDRFNGIANEPRPNLKSGKIPGSFNLPYHSVLDNGFLKPQNDLKQIFLDLKIDREKPIIFSCGSGITACIILLAAEMVLNNPKSVYDGSWTEWALKQRLIKQ